MVLKSHNTSRRISAVISLIFHRNMIKRAAETIAIHSRPTCPSHLHFSELLDNLSFNGEAGEFPQQIILQILALF